MNEIKKERAKRLQDAKAFAPIVDDTLKNGSLTDREIKILCHKFFIFTHSSYARRCMLLEVLAK